MVLLLCALFAATVAFAPVARAFFRLEASYNEGWNVYNAATVAARQPLYGAACGWTTVNYPMLSFALVAWLSHWTHEYLFTARMLSLASFFLCCLFVALIVRRFGGTRFVAWIAGFFSLAIFCTAADYPSYIGVDDPQMLALVFFLAGFYCYLRAPRSFFSIAAAALLFVVGGSVKHNPIDFPLAVLLDLLLVSRKRAAWFAACCAGFGALSLLLQQYWGGPFLVADLLAGRDYSVLKACTLTGVNLGPLALPLAIALWTAWRLRHDPARRVISLWMVCALATGMYFIGGDGVSINALFSVLLALCVLVALWLQRFSAGQPLACGALFAWLLIPWLVVPPLCAGRPLLPVWNPVRVLAAYAGQQQQFDAEVARLRAVPGPVLCESLLRCAYAGKPYLYDPFNATRFVTLGRLDPRSLEEAIHAHRFGAIQMDGPMLSGDRTSHFAPVVLEAIRSEYRPMLNGEDGAIYAPLTPPRTTAAWSLSASPASVGPSVSASLRQGKVHAFAAGVRIPRVF